MDAPFFLAFKETSAGHSTTLKNEGGWGGRPWSCGAEISQEKCTGLFFVQLQSALAVLALLLQLGWSALHRPEPGVLPQLHHHHPALASVVSGVRRSSPRFLDISHCISGADALKERAFSFLSPPGLKRKRKNGPFLYPQASLVIFCARRAEGVASFKVHFPSRQRHKTYLVPFHSWRPADATKGGRETNKNK